LRKINQQVTLCDPIWRRPIAVRWCIINSYRGPF